MSLHINFLSWIQVRQWIKPPPSQYFSMKFHERQELFSKHKSVVKTPHRLQENSCYHMTNVLQSLKSYFFTVFLHNFTWANRTWEVLKALLYLLKNTVDQMHNHLILKSLGMSEKILSAQELHTFKKPKQTKQPNPTAEFLHTRIILYNTSTFRKD